MKGKRISTAVVVITILAVLFISIIWQQIEIIIPTSSTTTTSLKNDSTLHEKNQTTTTTIIVNATRVKEINETLANISKISGLYNRRDLQNTLERDDYTPVTVVTSSPDKVKWVLSNLSSREFKIQHQAQGSSIFDGYVTIEGLVKLNDDQYVTKIYYGIVSAVNQLQESVPLINADKVWLNQVSGLNLTGKGQTVCLIDTGINYTHPDLGSCFGSNCKIIAGWNYIDNNGDINDTDGHGTRMAGIITANGQLKGVAPNSSIAIVKASGAGSSGISLVNAINWCIANKNDYNISAISVSWAVNLSGVVRMYNTACDGEDIVVDATNNASANYNLPVVVASGNYANNSGITSPACGSKVTSVGATYDYNGDGISGYHLENCSYCYDTAKIDELWCGTNRASILDIVAPGTLINSTNRTSGYENNYGTSDSAPHVAGVVALMKQANNSLSPSEIENIMEQTGRPVYDSATGLTFKRVDALKAVLATYNDLVVTDFQALSKKDFNVTFEMKIFNRNNQTVNNVYWTIDTGNNAVLTNKNNTNITLGPYEEVFIYTQYNYTTTGTFTATAYANSSQYKSNSQTASLSFGQALNVSNFSVINSVVTTRIFEFIINNTGNVTLGNISWQLSTGNSLINSTKNITLAPMETVFVYVAHDYVNQGNYTANVTVSAPGFDKIISSNINISIGVVSTENLILTNFTNISSSGSSRVFEFFIKHDGVTSIGNIYWNMTVSGEAGVKSTLPITLAKNETAFVYVKYNYTTGGPYTLNVTVDPANLLEEYNETDNSIVINDS